jgi:hypothetical protein
MDGPSGILYQNSNAAPEIKKAAYAKRPFKSFFPFAGTTRIRYCGYFSAKQ